MKKNVFVLAVFFSLMFIGSVSAVCNLGVSLLNQDPYPAVQGDYLKLVFQVTGLQDPSCTEVYFELENNYPISFDPGVNSKVQIKGGTFTQNFKSSLTVPYKVRVDPNAVDGDNEITVRYGVGPGSEGYYTKKFNISVEDARTDFEIFLKNYNPATKTMTLEVLNTGKKDVEALTLEIKKGDNINLLGPSVNVIGSLDSNDFTTADFEGELSNGSLPIEIRYTDAAGIRRDTNKTISINVDPFIEKASSQKGGFSSWTFFLIIAILIIAYFFYRRRKKRRHLEHRR